MAIKQTIKLSEKSSVTTINNTDKIIIVGSNGSVKLITPADLMTSILSGRSLEALDSNIFIMFHDSQDSNLAKMVKPSGWTSLQTRGEVADGVVVVEGGKVLVVAPTEYPGNSVAQKSIYWSNNAAFAYATKADLPSALTAFDGKSSTSAITGNNLPDSADPSYAPGFCINYSRTNGNGYGLTAGKWWLPSLGELMMMNANLAKINRALSLIDGAEQLASNRYWSSIEPNNNGYQTAWTLYMGGSPSSITKNSVKCRVRPVSEFTT